MNLIRPQALPYDVATWRNQPFPERVRQVCAAWAVQGYGAPAVIYLGYAVKIAAFMAGWVAVCTTTTGFDLQGIGGWWSSQQAFLKGMVWTMLFEGLGFGCGSGPLTGRYVPPFGGMLYFLRPGTTKLPLVRVPWLGTHLRTVVDVALYAAIVALLTRAVLAPEVTAAHLWPIAVLVPLASLLDRTLFLMFRSEHYLSVLLVFLLAPTEWVAGSKVVWLAIWWWAALSKLTPHFPYVVSVMTSNAPIAPVAVRRAMTRDFPNDLRPSNLAWWLAHTGTVLEAGYPLVLFLSDGGPATAGALLVMTVFHLFILSQVPMGVPLEWNVVMIYGGFVLFGVHADVFAFDLASPALIAWLVGFHLVLPLYGSLVPARVSFLLSMRYYAGNWASNIWLFKPGASDRLDERLVKAAKLAKHQLGPFYDPDTIEGMLSKVVAFRLMHLHGRAHALLARQAVDDLDTREWLDGEMIAGLVLGWNFGDGHLHRGELLEAIQAQCQFAPGELRVISLESQPLFGATQAWVIRDAHDGVIAQGEIRVEDMLGHRDVAAC